MHRLAITSLALVPSYSALWPTIQLWSHNCHQSDETNQYYVAHTNQTKNAQTHYDHCTGTAPPPNKPYYDQSAWFTFIFWQILLVDKCWGMGILMKGRSNLFIVVFSWHVLFSLYIKFYIPSIHLKQLYAELYHIICTTNHICFIISREMFSRTRFSARLIM